MQEPDLVERRSPRGERPDKVFGRVRGLRWLGAGLLLLTVAFLFHTSGPTAAMLQGQVRYWMRATPRQPQGSGLRSARSAALAGTGSDWSAPVTSAGLLSAFGWRGSGAQARFHAGLTVHIAPGIRVRAGVRGRVIGVRGDAVIVRVGPYQLRLAPLRARVSVGQRLYPVTAVGVSRQALLTIQITRDGYPVNPLSPGLYGVGWIHH